MRVSLNYFLFENSTLLHKLRFLKHRSDRFLKYCKRKINNRHRKAFYWHIFAPVGPLPHICASTILFSKPSKIPVLAAFMPFQYACENGDGYFFSSTNFKLQNLTKVLALKTQMPGSFLFNLRYSTFVRRKMMLQDLIDRNLCSNPFFFIDTTKRKEYKVLSLIYGCTNKSFKFFFLEFYVLPHTVAVGIEKSFH